ncbi:MAG: thiol:disulfide interchange protein DsbA/DsbL [Pseudomonadota bacterium]
MRTIIKPFILLALLFAGSAMAQSLYVEGTHYETLDKPVRTVDPNKVEVTEVFWYGCPHCYAFEPLLESWLRELPSDVAFVRMPGMWNALMETHARIFYVEQALGSFDKTHKVVFDAFHQKQNYLQTQEACRELFVAQGIDPAAFDKAWTSFSVTSSVKQAGTRMREYGVNGVPNLIVNGKYRVSSGDAVVTQADMLKVVDYLIAKERAN